MKNWKTTLAGAVGAAVIIVNKYSGLDLPVAEVTAIAILIVALVSKDYDTTGTGAEAEKPGDTYNQKY